MESRVEEVVKGVEEEEEGGEEEGAGEGVRGKGPE